MSNYATFFQDAIDNHQANLAARRRQVQKQHARITGLLAPLLNGLEQAVVGRTYQDYTASGTIHGPVEMDRFTDDQAQQTAFSLKCQGRTILTIELNKENIHLRNGVQQRDWRLQDFAGADVESAAHSIAEWIVPRLLENEVAGETPPAGRCSERKGFV